MGTPNAFPACNYTFISRRIPQPSCVCGAGGQLQELPWSAAHRPFQELHCYRGAQWQWQIKPDGCHLFCIGCTHHPDGVTVSKLQRQWQSRTHSCRQIVSTGTT
eukprot:1066375-Pelagomonas_calceolata.AAC.1